MSKKKKINFKKQTIVAYMTEETFFERIDKCYNQVKDKYPGKTDEEIRGGALAGIVANILADMHSQLDLKDGQYFNIVIGENPDNWIISTEGNWNDYFRHKCNAVALSKYGYDLQAVKWFYQHMQYVLDNLERFVEDWESSKSENAA